MGNLAAYGSWSGGYISIPAETHDHPSSASFLQENTCLPTAYTQRPYLASRLLQQALDSDLALTGM